MPVPTIFPIDNGQNNQLEIKSLMHSADASNFTEGGAKAVTIAVLHPKGYSYLTNALDSHIYLGGSPVLDKCRMEFTVAIMHLFKILSYFLIMPFFNLHRMPCCYC